MEDANQVGITDSGQPNKGIRTENETVARDGPLTAATDHVRMTQLRAQPPLPCILHAQFRGLCCRLRKYSSYTFQTRNRQDYALWPTQCECNETMCG
jgi:hypothetical protein